MSKRLLCASGFLCLLAAIHTNAEPLRGYPGQAKSKGNGPPTEYGETVAHGNGGFTPFGTVAGEVPRSIGISFPASTLEGQPTEPSDGGWDIIDADGNVVWHCCGHERELDVPDNMLDPTLHGRPYARSVRLRAERQSF